MIRTTLSSSRRGLLSSLLIGAMCAGAALSGCRQDIPPVSVGNFHQLTGDLESIEPATLDQAWGATLTAMDRLGFVVSQQDRTNVEGRILAHTQGGRDVNIRLTRETTILTRIRIRIAMLGDEIVSRAILEQIESQLPGSKSPTDASSH